jgi:hypothetical protein
MARETRRGPIAAPAGSASGMSYAETRKQNRLEKKRKKFELEEEAKKKNDRDGCTSGGDRVSRSRTIEIDALYAAPSQVAALPPTTSSPARPAQRMTRRDKPSCTDFGLMRHGLYNKPVSHWFFCRECDQWDNDKNIVPNIKQTSRRYKCVAGHRSCVFPTTPLPPVSLRLKAAPAPAPAPGGRRSLGFDESGMDLEENVLPAEEQVLASTSTTSLEQESLEQEAIIRELRTKVNRLQRRVRYFEERSAESEATKVEELLSPPCSPAVRSGRKNPKSENARFHEEVTRMLNKVVAKYKWGSIRVGRELATLFFEYSDSLCHDVLISKAKRWLRENVYTCYNILREMDRAGGTLGYEGIEIIRAAETKRVKSYKGSLIPSSGDFKRAAEKVEKLAHHLAPFVLGVTSTGDKEAIDFQPYWKIMGTVFRAYGLMGAGKAHSCLCVYALDGAAITKNLGHVLGGFKVADPSATCPMTGDLLLANPTEMNAQSRNLCFPLKMIMGKETKETIKEFSPMFQFMEDCESDDPTKNPMTLHWGMLPLTCAANCDLSAGWKCLCKGGAAKVSNHPCHCCALYKSKWALQNSEAKLLDCNWCHELHSGVPNWKCYHHPMMTPESLSMAQVELNRLMEGLSGSLERVEKESRLQVDDADDATPESRRNPMSIHYCPGTNEEKLKYGEFLTAELIIRDMSPFGTISAKRVTLRKAARSEANVRLLLTELAHGTPSEGAMFLLIQAIPCILHMENRVGIKILTMLVIEGLSNAKAGLLYPDIRAEGPRISHFFRSIADIVNKQVLGTPDNSAEWECATDDKKKEIGTITMDNMRTRAIMAKLELLIEECIVKLDDKAKWLACIPKFRDGMIKLRSKENFTNDAVTAFQKDIDEFNQLWVELWGLEGVTNYIHMMSSGHLSTYLFKWKNLYRHSQQGWEAFNSLVKTFYFRRTQRGGRSNAGRGRKTRLLPIGRWLQRRVVWLCGYDQAYIESWIEENPGARRSGEAEVGEGETEEEEEEEDIYTGAEGFI